MKDTQTLVKATLEGLARSKVPVGTPAPRTIDPSPLRYVALGGILCGIVLLGMGLPKPFGWPVTAVLVLFCLAYAKSSGPALLAALIFPVLGFLYPKKGLATWLWALLYALCGVVFLNALASTTVSMLGLSPFKGVSLTLLVPPLLVALSMVPRNFKATVLNIWKHPVLIGEVVLALAAVVVLALVVLRRGNETSSGITPDWEIQLRAVLQDVMVRPRFKEVFAAAVAPFAFMWVWPTWIHNGLKLLVSLGVASILNTFSHFHTPLSISFFRTVNGLVLGAILGLVLLAIFKRVVQWWNKEQA